VVPIGCGLLRDAAPRAGVRRHAAPRAGVRRHLGRRGGLPAPGDPAGLARAAALKRWGATSSAYYIYYSIINYSVVIHSGIHGHASHSLVSSG
jgi:hypothetical protein